MADIFAAAVRTPATGLDGDCGFTLYWRPRTDLPPGTGEAMFRIWWKSVEAFDGWDNPLLAGWEFDEAVQAVYTGGMFAGLEAVHKRITMAGVIRKRAEDTRMSCNFLATRLADGEFRNDGWVLESFKGPMHTSIMLQSKDGTPAGLSVAEVSVTVLAEQLRQPAEKPWPPCDTVLGFGPFVPTTAGFRIGMPVGSLEISMARRFDPGWILGMAFGRFESRMRSVHNCVVECFKAEAIQALKQEKASLLRQAGLEPDGHGPNG